MNSPVNLSLNSVYSGHLWNGPFSDSSQSSWPLLWRALNPQAVELEGLEAPDDDDDERVFSPTSAPRPGQGNQSKTQGNHSSIKEDDHLPQGVCRSFLIGQRVAIVPGVMS
uniref:Uncharacterized protein n=1 Tax=Knipowitschia caucasica TaxID=637954 RepID=A0AAV2JUC6_KNICA